MIRLLLYKYKKLLISKLYQRKLRKWEKNTNFVSAKMDNIHINLYKDSKLAELIYLGNFERMEISFLKKYLRKGDIFVDVGANIGLFSLVAAKILRETGAVFAFEPYKLTYHRLCENVKLNKFRNVYCHPIAISNKIGKEELMIAGNGYDAWNSFTEPIAGNIIKKEVVQTTTLDTFTQENDIQNKISIIKIDVEGWEKFVLLGGKNTLSNHNAPVLIVEFADKALYNAGTSAKELYNSLEKLGFKLYVYDMIENQLFHELFQPPYPYNNLIALKNLDMVINRIK